MVLNMNNMLCALCNVQIELKKPKMAKNTQTRSKSVTLLIGQPCEKITGARLPSGRDIIRNFVFFHRLKKMTVADSARQVHDQLMPFWTKSRLPVRQKQHIVQKIKDLYREQVRLKSSHEKDKVNQKRYTQKLSNLFDISHANAKSAHKKRRG